MCGAILATDLVRMLEEEYSWKDIEKITKIAVGGCGMVLLAVILLMILKNGKAQAGGFYLLPKRTKK